MRHLCLGLFGTALSMACSTASAQTASETVAFILFGLEDGRTINSEDGTVRIEKINSDSAATYEITLEDKSSPPPPKTTKFYP